MCVKFIHKHWLLEAAKEVKIVFSYRTEHLLLKVQMKMSQVAIQGRKSAPCSFNTNILNARGCLVMGPQDKDKAKSLLSWH